MGRPPAFLINYNWHDFNTFRTFSPEHIRSDQASLIFQEVMELEEQHGHEFSGEYCSEHDIMFDIIIAYKFVTVYAIMLNQ